MTWSWSHSHLQFSMFQSIKLSQTLKTFLMKSSTKWANSISLYSRHCSARITRLCVQWSLTSYKLKTPYTDQESWLICMKRCTVWLIRNFIMSTRRLKNLKNVLKQVCSSMLIKKYLRITKSLRRLSTKRNLMRWKTCLTQLGKFCKMRSTVWTIKMIWKLPEKHNIWITFSDYLGTIELSHTGMSSLQKMCYTRLILVWLRLKKEYWNS